MKKRFFLPVLLAALCACNAAVPTPPPPPPPTPPPAFVIDGAPTAMSTESFVGRVRCV